MQRLTLSFVIFLLVMTSMALAASPPAVRLVIRQQQFHPAKLTIPAGTQVKIMVKNMDAVPAEFESYDFNREKVIPGKSEVAVYVGPMKAGTYGFFNDFHQSSKGKLVVK